MAKLNLTFEDVEKAARDAGVYDQISVYDWQLARQDPSTAMEIVNAKTNWNNATTSEARSAANAAAEAARAKFQYSGGSWGNEYNPWDTPSASGVDYTNLSNYMQAPQTVSLPELTASVPTFQQVSTPSFDSSKYSVAPYSSPYSAQINAGLERLNNQGSFSYDGTAPVYSNAYSDRIADALNNVTDYGKFSYDKNTDPVYAAYAQTYRREGDRAARNALAQAATRSGGANSSATIAASQQAQNYYGAQLADKIPELYQQAYARYSDEFNRNLSKLGALNQQEQYDYAKYLTNLGQFNDDRNFALNSFNANNDAAYKALQGALAADTNAQSAWSLNATQSNTDRAFDYGMTRDAVSDAQWNALNAYNAGMDAYNAAVDQQKLGLDVNKTNAELYQQAIDNAYKQQALAADIAQFNADYDYTKEVNNQDYLFKLASAAADMGDYSLLNNLLSEAGGGTVSLDSIYALKNYGNGSGSPGESKKKSADGSVKVPESGGIPGDVIAQLKKLYPSGIITNKVDWDALVSEYGESVVKAAGYSYKAASNPKVGSDKRADEAGKHLADNSTYITKRADVNFGNTEKSSDTEFVEGWGWLSPAEIDQLVYTGAIKEVITKKNGQTYISYYSAR